MMSTHTNFEQVRKQGLFDPKWEKDISVIFCRYMKNTAIYDIIANVPILIYEFEYNFSHSEEEIKASLGTSSFFGLVQFCKFLRLLHISTLFKTQRAFYDKLGNAFYQYRYMVDNIHKWESAALKLILGLHYMACGWIWIYSTKTYYERRTIEFSDDTSETAIYVDSIYLMTTTVSTVGYGDFKGHISDTEDY